MPDDRVIINNNTKPPYYDGDKSKDANVHWLKFQDYIEEANIPEDLRVSKFRLTLQGEPRQWYEDNKDSFADLNTLERLFKAEFTDSATHAEYWRQLQTIKMQPNESVVEYKKRVFRTAVKANMKDDKEIVVSCFISGLPENIRSHVRSKCDTSLDDALKTARTVLIDTPASQATAAPTVFSVQQDKHSAMNDLTKQVSHFRLTDSQPRNRSSSRNRFHSKYDRSSSRSRYGQRFLPNRHVSRSNSRSHSRGRNQRRGRDATPLRQRRDTSGSKDRGVTFRSKSRSPSPGTCYYCNKPGHTSDFCRVLKKHLRQGKIKMQNFI